MAGPAPSGRKTKNVPFPRVEPSSRPGSSELLEVLEKTRLCYKLEHNNLADVHGPTVAISVSLLLRGGTSKLDWWDLGLGCTWTSY